VIFYPIPEKKQNIIENFEKHLQNLQIAVFVHPWVAKYLDLVIQ
jgi:hypothetical protein